MGVANIKYYLLQIFYAMKYILGGLPNIPAIRALRITGSSGIAIFNSLLHILLRIRFCLEKKTVDLCKQLVSKSVRKF